MSAYCTVAHVQVEVKALDVTSPNSVLNTADVERLIDEESAKIDNIIGSRYLLPIDPTAVISLALLQKICVECVACRVTKIIGMRQPIRSDSKASQSPNLCDACERNEALLYDIKNGKLALQDAQVIEDYISTFYQDNDICATFKKDVMQW